MAVVTQIQARRGTAAQWTSANPTLAAGEWGYETDTGKVKIGNGSTVWNSLGYTGAGDIEGVTASTGLTGGGTTGTVSLSIDTSVTADLTTAQTLTNKTLTDPKINLALNAQTGTTYTFVLTDNGKLVTASNGSAQTYSIPTNASVAFPTGTQINIIQIGAGQVTINAVTSGTTTIASTGATATAPKLRAQYSSATCIKVATDTWYVVGDIA
jgi:hypothetical protein